MFLILIFYSPFQVKGSHLFTASGAQYYYLFNISLCSQTAVCSNNVSYQQEGQATQVSENKIIDYFFSS